MLFSKKINNSEFELNNVFFPRQSKSKNEDDDEAKLSGAYKNINNIINNCIESIGVKEKEIETIDSPIFKSLRGRIKRHNMSSNKIMKSVFQSNTKKTFNLNKSNTLSNSNNNLIKTSDENLIQSLNVEYETQKKGVLRKKTSPSKINKTKTNKSEKAKPSNLKHYIINGKIVDLPNSNSNMTVSSKFKNAKTVKFLFGQKKDESTFKKKSTNKFEKENSNTKDLKKNSTLISKQSNISYKTNKTIKDKHNKNNKNFDLFNNIESYSPKSIKTNRLKKNKNKIAHKFKRRLQKLKTFGFLSSSKGNELNNDKLSSKNIIGHHSKKSVLSETKVSNPLAKINSIKRPNTTIVSAKEGQNILDCYIKKKGIKKKTSKKNMKILTLEEIGKNVRDSIVGFNFTEIKKQMYDLENNDISEAIKNLPTKYYSSLNDANPTNNLILKKETNKNNKEITLSNSSELESRSSEESNIQVNRYQQKYRKLFMIKKVYDSLDDEELGDEEDINPFYISPNSLTVYFIDSFVFISAFLELLYLPVFLGYKKYFCRKFLSFDSILFYIFDLIYIMDLITGFFRGYYNFEENLIKNNVDICMNYLKGWFFIDFLEAIPLYTIFNLNERKCDGNIIHNLYIGDFVNYHYSLLIVKILKIFKVFTYNKAYDKTIDFLNRSDFFNNWNGVFFTLLVTLSLTHFCSCFLVFLGRNIYPGWIMVRKIQDESFSYIYLTAIYYLMTTLTTVGYGDIIILTTYERIYQIILLIVGTCAYSWILTFISNYIKKMNEQYIDFENKVQILSDIKIQYPLLKNELYEKIIRYLKYNKSENKYNVDFILDSLPLSLKNNVIIDMYKPIIKNFQFFKSFQNSDFFVKIVTSLKPILSMKDDILVQEGDVIEDIIFIKKGVLSLEIYIDLDCPQESCEAHLNMNGFNQNLEQIHSVKSGKGYNSQTITSSNINYTKNNSKVKNEIKKLNKKPMNIINLRKNEHYGDILMILNERSPLTVKVKSKKAELFFLQKTDATEISNKYPNIWKRIVHKSLFNMKQIKYLIKKKIIIFCDLNGILISPELRKSVVLNLEEDYSFDDTLYQKDKAQNIERKKSYIKSKNNSINEDSMHNSVNKSNIKRVENNQFDSIIYEVDENLESNQNSTKKVVNSDENFQHRFPNKKNKISEISNKNNSLKTLGCNFSNKKEKASEFTSLFSSNNMKSGIKEFLNKSISSNNSFRKIQNIDYKETVLTFNSNSNSSDLSNNKNSLSNSTINDQQSLQETAHDKETDSNKYDENKNSQEVRRNKKLSSINNKINKMITEKMRPSKGQINNLNINIFTHKTVNYSTNNKRNSVPSVSKKKYDYIEEEEEEEEDDVDDVNDEIYSNESFIVNIGKNIFFNTSDKNNNVIYPYLNELIYNKNSTNLNLPKLLEKSKSKVSLIKDDNSKNSKNSRNSKISKNSKNSDLIKSSGFSNLYTTTSISFTLNSIYDNLNKLTGYKIQKDLHLQKKIKNYILDECFFQINSINYIHKNNHFHVNSSEEKRKTYMNRSSLKSRNSKFSKTSSIVGNISSNLPFNRNEKYDERPKKIRARNSVKIRKRKFMGDSNVILEEKTHRRKKRRNTNVFRQINNTNASFLDHSNISNIHVAVPQEDTSFLKKKTSKKANLNLNLKLNDDEEMSFYTKMKTIRNMKNSTISNDRKSFISKPKEFSLMDQISQNIQKNKQNLNNPEEYFSGFFTNLLQTKKTMAKGPSKTNKKNTSFIKRTSTSSEVINRNNMNFKFNI